MQTATMPTRKSFHYVGGPISRDFLASLTEGYKAQHPTEQTAVFIAREHILDTLRQLPNISGLRFIYGINEGADPSSRSIVLVPCNDSSEGKPIPNLLFLRDGYLNSEGKRLSADACWSMFTRYVDRMTQLVADTKRNQIPRACFFGIHILEEMLSDDRCAGIIYHFGYHADEKSFPLRYKAALVVVDGQMVAFDPPVDMGMPCPPDTVCDPGGGGVGGIFFGSLLRGIDNDPLSEMYHYALPSLSEVIQRSGMTEAESLRLYESQFAPCVSLIEAGRQEEAGFVFKDRLNELVSRYLYSN